MGIGSFPRPLSSIASIHTRSKQRHLQESQDSPLCLPLKRLINCMGRRCQSPHSFEGVLLSVWRVRLGYTVLEGTDDVRPTSDHALWHGRIDRQLRCCRGAAVHPVRVESPLTKTLHHGAGGYRCPRRDSKGGKRYGRCRRALW